MSDVTNAPKRYGVGGGDAYYDAVTYGGYTGTRAEFGEDQAKFAENAQQVREDREAVEATVATFTETTVPAAVQSVADEGTTQIGLVAGAGTTQVGLVQSEGTTQIGLVAGAGTTQVGLVQSEGSTQIGLVQAEGATQIAAVEDKGEEVLESIPQDYTDLSNDVDLLKQQITDADLFVDNIVTPTSVVTGQRLDPQTGLRTNNASYQLLKYAVTAGDEYTVVSADSFQFQNVEDVPSSEPSNRIGETYGTGTFNVVVPDGATYLIVSVTTSNPQSYVTQKAAFVAEGIDNGSLYTDAMADGVSNILRGRRFTVKKNHVYIASTSGASSTYRFCNIFGTPVIRDENWGTSDLSSDYFCPIGFDASVYHLMMRVQWEKTYSPYRNPVYLATKNETSGVVTKVKVCDDADDSIKTINLSTLTPEIVENGNFALYVISQNTNYTNNFKYWLYLADRYGNAPDIIELNTDAINRVHASNWWWGEHTLKPSLLNLLHFSDIHGWKESLVRVVEMKNHLKRINLLSDSICTGDIQKASYAGGQFESVWRATPGTEDILFTIGNHDTYVQQGTPGKLTEAEKYTAYFDGYTTAMGITMAANTSYWYKDYPSQGIRLIGVDPSVVDTDSDQKSWLDTTLAEAKSLGYAVIVASHYLRLTSSTDITSVTLIDNDWSNSRARALTTDTMTYDWAGTDIVKCVSDFVDGGGKFICYIIGHTHTDILSHPTGRPEQLIINVCAAAIEEATGENRVRTSNDLPRVADTITRDAFNLITVDTSNNLLKCVRFGANVNMLQKPRTAFVYDYNTHTFLTVA